MKLAVDCRMIGSGGIGSYIAELIPHLLKENCCVLLGKHEACKPFLSSNNAEFCFCAVPPFSLAELVSFPADCLRAINGCDAYLTPYCNIPGGITVPIFATIHDVVFLDVPALTSAPGRFVRKCFYRRAVNASAAIFTVSEFSRERIMHHLRCKKPVEITYDAAPAYLTEPFSADEAVQKTDTILFVGNIKKHKGLSVLLAAYETAKKGGLTSTLTIVGNADNFRTQDTEIAARLNAAQKNGIVFTGRVSDAQLKRLYAEARFLVQPSLYEGFGMPPLEAMTLGTPAIISDIPVFREIYAGFPVTYFASENADDLAEKMLSFDDTAFSKAAVPDRYSYEKSARVIISTIRKYVR